MSTLERSGRFHALDNLRAIMMWLGIVLHVSINHITSNAPTPWRDAEMSPLADLIFITIHAFRMPVFFILAAFLAAMMVDKRGYSGMLRNRVRRIALPFAAFWPLIFVAMGVLVLNYRHVMLFGTFGLSTAAAPAPMPGRPGIGTMHMWFLYYLFLFSLAAAALGMLEHRIPQGIRSGAAKLMATLSGSWWGVLVLALPLALAGSGYPYGMVAPYGSFIPTLPEVIHNGMFFVAGWYLYRNREAQLARLTRLGWRYMAAGCVPFVMCLKLYQLDKLAPGSLAHFELLAAFVYGATSWLWGFGLIGLFLRYLPRQNAVFSYMAESSYWVFLVHMLGTLGFGALLYNAPLGAGAKMGINILATTAFALLSYHLFVRNTWIGAFLNGKKPDSGKNETPLTAAP